MSYNAKENRARKHRVLIEQYVGGIAIQANMELLEAGEIDEQQSEALARSIRLAYISQGLPQSVQLAIGELERVVREHVYATATLGAR